MTSGKKNIYSPLICKPCIRSIWMIFFCAHPSPSQPPQIKSLFFIFPCDTIDSPHGHNSLFTHKELPLPLRKQPPCASTERVLGPVLCHILPISPHFYRLRKHRGGGVLGHFICHTRGDCARDGGGYSFWAFRLVCASLFLPQRSGAPVQPTPKFWRGSRGSSRLWWLFNALIKHLIFIVTRFIAKVLCIILPHFYMTVRSA